MSIAHSTLSAVIPAEAGTHGGRAPRRVGSVALAAMTAWFSGLALNESAQAMPSPAEIGKARSICYAALTSLDTANKEAASSGFKVAPRVHSGLLSSDAKMLIVFSATDKAEAYANSCIVYYACGEKCWHGSNTIFSRSPHPRPGCNSIREKMSASPRREYLDLLKELVGPDPLYNQLSCI